ncbi:MAG: hypothetical protein R2710_17595 [Acidimicrobiales bacterium]
MSTYVVEEFTAAEADVLRRYFTNLDLPVFALVNLPEVVKGALFARYSRSPKSLRRLFLDEFVGELDIEGDSGVDATMGLDRAEQLYERIFVEYGDDSVAQLGGVHLACEQASNLLTKVLEWGRLASYLEQSTRYISYDSRVGGRYRYYRDPVILGSNSHSLRRRSRSAVRHLRRARRHRHRPRAFHHTEGGIGLRLRVPPGDQGQGARRRPWHLARSRPVERGYLRIGAGLRTTLLRMRSHPLPEAQLYADLMLTELRKVIPSFVRRVDLPAAWNGASTWPTLGCPWRTSPKTCSTRPVPPIPMPGSSWSTSIPTPRSSSWRRCSIPTRRCLNGGSRNRCGP